MVPLFETAKDFVTALHESERELMATSSVVTEYCRLKFFSEYFDLSIWYPICSRFGSLMSEWMLDCLEEYSELFWSMLWRLFLWMGYPYLKLCRLLVIFGGGVFTSSPGILSSEVSDGVGSLSHCFACFCFSRIWLRIVSNLFFPPSNSLGFGGVDAGFEPCFWWKTDGTSLIKERPC